ncbi:hypothetical protein BGW39_001537 [Mortierella sp. 14UC]|nr:hypothetical protein BGW39_001537 [Mortierella sp. 14UC]
MAPHCNHCDSSSQYPPVCCVHNTESQPLLGHHAHSSQQAPPPPEYCIDMNGGDSKGAYYAPAPTHNHQCTCLHDNYSRSRKNKCARFLFFFVFFVLAYNFLNRMIFSDPHHHHEGPWSANNELDALSNDSNNLNYDHCRDNAIDWDGPSTFTTEVKNFRLKIGQGNIFSRVNISTGPVALPTLHIIGEVSPYDNGSLNRKEIKPSAAHDDKIDIDYLGLHMEIVELDNQFDAQVWYDKREVVDPRDNQRYRACARLIFEIILPESFTQYGSISVDGPVVAINAHGLENVKFDRLHFGSSVGAISTRGRIQTDVFDANSNTGRVSTEAVQVATAGKPLDIQITTTTGSVQVTAETTDVDAAEENPHKVHVTTNTGRIELTVQPSTSSFSIDAKHGNLDIQTHAKTGSIDATVLLASQDQILTLSSKTNTGSIRTHISDEFLGHFDISTKWGSTRVQPAKDSKSTIAYEKSNAREKVGTKVLDDQEGEVKGLIEISTSTGSTSLEFIN